MQNEPCLPFFVCLTGFKMGLTARAGKKPGRPFWLYVSNERLKVYLIYYWFHGHIAVFPEFTQGMILPTVNGEHMDTTPQVAPKAEDRKVNKTANMLLGL